MIFAMRSIGRIEHQILALALPAATAQILLVVSVQDETEVSVFVRMSPGAYSSTRAAKWGDSNCSIGLPRNRPEGSVGIIWIDGTAETTG
jgi:hypothetical protein